MEKKPASFLAVSLEKALNKVPPFLFGRQVVKLNNLLVVVGWWPSRTKNLQTANELICLNE